MAPRRTSTSLVPGPFPSGPGMALATATPRPAPPATPTGATSHDHFGTCTPCHPTCHPACCAPRQPATHRAAGSARGRPATGPGTFALFRPAHCPASTAAAGGALSSAPARDRAANADGRSEEHTSELQSPCNLVCRLLLEKKNEYQIKEKYAQEQSH